MTAAKSPFLPLVVAVLSGAPALAQAGRPLHFLSKQCEEDALVLRMEPGPLQERVGSGFSLALANGKARVLVVVQDCGQYWMDGEDVGPTSDVQVWVAVRGPEDVRPIMGAERTQPTGTWFSLFAASSNPRVRSAKSEAGTTPAPVERLALDPPAPRRGGRFAVGRASYSWVATSVAPAIRLLGLNHDVYVRDAAGRLSLNRVQAVGRLSAGPSSGTLEVAGTDPAQPIRAGTYPVTVQSFSPIWIRTTLGFAASRGGEPVAH